MERVTTERIYKQKRSSLSFNFSTGTNFILVIRKLS